MTLDDLLKQYEHGPNLLKAAISGVREHQFDQTPVPGRWSIRQVVCHIADFEPVYADRMKRVLVEDNPTMFGGDPDVFAAGLHRSERINNIAPLVEHHRQPGEHRQREPHVAAAPQHVAHRPAKMRPRLSLLLR